MDEATIQERLRILEAAKAKALADLNAVIGAVEECGYWLSVLQAEGRRDETHRTDDR